MAVCCSTHDLDVMNLARPRSCLLAQGVAKENTQARKDQLAKDKGWSDDQVEIFYRETYSMFVKGCVRTIGDPASIEIRLPR